MENPPNIPEKFLKPYDPSSVERATYERWESSGFFNPDVCVKEGITAPDAKSFTIMMPPPNVTGVLHMGHAMMLTLEDIMIRFKRMQGYKTLWLPGTDHAAIATQSKVEKEIQKKEGKSRHDLGREELLNRVRAFAQESHDTIVSQVKVMGASCDWSREAFTLDATRNRAVNTMFKKMYDDGLIYRGHRIVNWDPKGQTTIADDEIVYEERKAKLYTFKYSKDFPISISTTRPETKVGDTAVAVHPEDPRYKEFVGKEYDAVFCGVPIHIKIIADETVEKEFGTGALGVTPAHSMTDWEIADRHNLPRPQVINEYAKMTVGGENLLGKKTTEAREVIVQWLRDEGLMEKEEDINQNVSTAERTGGIVEPLPKLQWFVDVNKEFTLPHSNLNGIPSGSKTTLKEIMRLTVQNQQIKIIPEFFNKTYFSWIENLRDWCISRQIWYGHRIPVWYDKGNKLHLPKRITLLLARHGESTANRDGVFSGGSIDSELTDTGKDQARALGNNLKGTKIDGVISSGMIRGKETARLACEELGIDPTSIIEIPELHEIKTERDGQPKTKEYPSISALVRDGRGETIEQIAKRADITLEKISALPEGTYLVCAHNAFNACLQARIMGLSGEAIIDHWTKVGIRDNGSVLEVTLIVNPSGDDLKQDEDTLDTWFSSGMWTFSTLGWPDKTKDLETYHPTDVLETGYEIIFFWVARMILMSGYALGEIPFHTVYFHGTVRDGQGRKMSKSLGNGIDPLDIAQKYGADAGRMALIVGTAPGTDSKISEDKIKGYKNFCNKLWNITRFILTNTENITIDETFSAWSEKDAQLHEEFMKFKSEITKEYEEYKFHLVSEKLYQYAWHTLADVVLENSKKIFAEGSAEEKVSRAQFLLHTLYDLLKLLHPLMPFVTEEIWSALPTDGRLLMVTKWPSYEPGIR
jgi:valyl-tRNA synthetase